MKHVSLGGLDVSRIGLSIITTQHRAPGFGA